MPIKKPSKEIKIREDNLSGVEYPIFCFKYLQMYSIKDCKDHEFFFRFLERLQKLSELGWAEIRKSNRHSFGTEHIPIDQIKPQTPAFITPDVNYLTAFRATGSKLPFLGILDGKIFHIIYIESTFGDIYDHN
ncbi:MAG TPA: hypothetical protein PKH79_01225 [Prolixibacteraceae bacterium]|nr:hypothetical protein [Prolixibacteraceae bacterium]HPS12078.1 hypothetical protein [Prolixibacteraceae bacterium]